jgi:hypothetical protein
VLSLDPVQVFMHYELAELALGSHLALLQTNGTLSAAKAREWWEYLQQADEHETLLISFTAFVVVGAKRRPLAASDMTIGWRTTRRTCPR